MIHRDRQCHVHAGEPPEYRSASFSVTWLDGTACPGCGRRAPAPTRRLSVWGTQGQRRGPRRPKKQGRRQKFISEGDKTGGLGIEVPQRDPGHSRGRALVGVWGPEAQDIYAKNHCNNVLTKTPKKFSAWKFPGGHAPLAPLRPPSLRSCKEGTSHFNYHVSVTIVAAGDKSFMLNSVRIKA